MVIGTTIMSQQSRCTCSQWKCCSDCEKRAPEEVTMADKERADQNLATALEMFRTAQGVWIATRRAESIYDDYCAMAIQGTCVCDKCTFGSQLELDLNKRRDRHRLRRAIGSPEGHDYWEVAKWFESWAAKSPAHLDPSAWRFSDTLKLAWNMRRLSVA